MDSPSDNKNEFNLAKINTPDDARLATQINASGHVQELDRNFNLLNACSLGIVTGNAWAAFGGSVVVAIYNGGPPGVIYEFLAVSIFYCLIAASLLNLHPRYPLSPEVNGSQSFELALSLSEILVYHWASVTAGQRWGRVVGWYAGYWNFFAWLFGAAAMCGIMGNQIVQMYSLYHVDFVAKQWHIFVVYVLTSTVCCAIVLYANRALPTINTIGLFLIVAGVLSTIIVCAVMPGTSGSGYASTAFVWKEWQNRSGYSSDGVVFLAGMLNGAFAIGTPDVVSHLAEEIPRPRVNLPIAIAAQSITGFVTCLCYMVAIFYAISNLDEVLSSTNSFPLAAIYHQATGSTGATLGLLIVIFLPCICAAVGCFITAGRLLWTLARDDATPCSRWIGHIDTFRKNPFNATLVCGAINVLLGCIYVGSTTAFNAFIGSFVVLVTLSYLAAVLPHVLSRRANIVPGPFSMGKITGYVVNCISCAYIIVFVVIYSFPYAIPFTAGTMNYTCLITGGLTIFVTAWWFWKNKHGYVGVKVNMMLGLEPAQPSRQKVDAEKI